MHRFHYFVDFGLNLHHCTFDTFGRHGRLLCEIFDFTGHDCKSFSGFAAIWNRQWSSVLARNADNCNECNSVVVLPKTGGGW